jgi:hypothetical protein
MRATITPAPCDGIVKFVNGSSVQCDAKIQVRWQPFFLPVRTRDKVSECQRKISSNIDVGENQVEAVAPSVIRDNRFRKFLS